MLEHVRTQTLAERHGEKTQHKDREGVALPRRISAHRGARLRTVRPPAKAGARGKRNGRAKSRRKIQKYLQMAELRAVHGESQVMPERALPSPPPPGAPGPEAAGVREGRGLQAASRPRSRGSSRPVPAGRGETAAGRTRLTADKHVPAAQRDPPPPGSGTALPPAGAHRNKRKTAPEPPAAPRSARPIPPHLPHSPRRGSGGGAGGGHSRPRAPSLPLLFPSLLPCPPSRLCLSPLPERRRQRLGPAPPPRDPAT